MVQNKNAPVKNADNMYLNGIGSESTLVFKKTTKQNPINILTVFIIFNLFISRVHTAYFLYIMLLF